MLLFEWKSKTNYPSHPVIKLCVVYTFFYLSFIPPANKSDALECYYISDCLAADRLAEALPSPKPRGWAGKEPSGAIFPLILLPWPPLRTAQRLETSRLNTPWQVAVSDPDRNFVRFFIKIKQNSAPESPSQPLQKPIFWFIRIQLVYADNAPELCRCN